MRLFRTQRDIEILIFLQKSLESLIMCTKRGIQKRTDYTINSYFMKRFQSMYTVHFHFIAFKKKLFCSTIPQKEKTKSMKSEKFILKTKKMKKTLTDKKKKMKRYTQTNCEKN